MSIQFPKSHMSRQNTTHPPTQLNQIPYLHRPSIILLNHHISSHFPKEIFLVQLTATQLHNHVVLGIFHFFSSDVYKSTRSRGYAHTSCVNYTAYIHQSLRMIIKPWPMQSVHSCVLCSIVHGKNNGKVNYYL